MSEQTTAYDDPGDAYMLAILGVIIALPWLMGIGTITWLFFGVLINSR
jgi:hypothetical protein